MADSDGLIVSEPVFEYLKPTIIFMRLFGLAPVSYKLVKKYYVIKRSTNYTIYSFAVAIFLGSFTILGLVSDANADDSLRMQRKNQRYVVMGDIGIVVWTVLFGAFMNPYKLKELLRVFHCFHKINVIMNESSRKLKREKHFALIVGLSVYIIFIGVIALDIYNWMDRFGKIEERMLYFKNYTTFYISYLVVISHEISYCNFTYYAKKRIMAMNAAISQEIHKKPEVFLLKERRLIRKSDPLHSGKLLDGTENDVLDNYVLESKTYSAIHELSPQKITNLIRVRAEIFDAVNSINDCFGYPLLFIMISCLLHLVITPFLFITGQYHKPLFIFLQVVWILVHLGRLIIIVEPTHRCLEENFKTNPLIVNLLSKVEEKDVRQKLETFALQGQLCILNFSSCGIVNIQRSILASIASAVTTYLVIMLQLNNN